MTAQEQKTPIVTASLIGVLPLQDAVLFPNTVIPLAVVKKPGIQLVEEALREGKPMPVDPNDSLGVIRIIEAARQSAQRGEVVRLPAGS